MADNTIIQQGSFVSTGLRTNIQLRSGVDWMRTYNLTQIAAHPNPGRGCQFYWQRGMATNSGIIYYNTAGAAVLNADIAGTLANSNGFTYVDTSTNPVGPVDTTVTAVSNATPPRVTVTSTAALSDGDIVRFETVTGALQLGGLDFTIDVIGGTTFDLVYMSTIVAGTNGAFRPIKYNPIFYPSYRYISAVTRGVTTVVRMTVTNDYTAGQLVRFKVPSDFGMVELDGLTGTILSTNAVTNTITVDIDSSAFTAFTFPLTAATPFTPAMVIPVGEGSVANFLTFDATENQSYIGMQLAGGILAPAGSANDVIYWEAGKSFNM